MHFNFFKFFAKKQLPTGKKNVTDHWCGVIWLRLMISSSISPRAFSNSSSCKKTKHFLYTQQTSLSFNTCAAKTVQTKWNTTKMIKTVSGKWVVNKKFDSVVVVCLIFTNRNIFHHSSFKWMKNNFIYEKNWLLISTSVSTMLKMFNILYLFVVHY